MSTKVDKLAQTAAVTPEVEAGHSNGTEPAVITQDTKAGKPKLWQRRRIQVGAGVLIVLLVSGVVANNLIARQYTPSGAVSAYLAALQSGDASAAWSGIQVTTSTSSPSTSLINQSALQAALASGKPDIKSFAITRTVSASPDTAAVSFTYDTASGSKQGSFALSRSGQNHFGIYPAWHVAVTPSILTIALPVQDGTVTVDGKPVAMGGPISQIAVLPLAHKVQLEGTPILQAQTLSVDLFEATTGSVSFAPTMTPLGMQKTKDAVKAAFTSCAAQTGVTTQGCPQAIDNQFARSVKWTVVGDPTQDLTVGVDKTYGLSATGHYQMVVAYQEDGITGTQHALSAGGYLAPLTVTSTDVSVGPMVRDSRLPPLKRPDGATDQAARDLASRAFAACAAATSASPADCPQQYLYPLDSVSRWTLNGDPLSGATVAFDPTSGEVTVAGGFDMSVTYTVSGYSYTRPSQTSKYLAHLLWNGQALQLVTIDGNF